MKSIMILNVIVDLQGKIKLDLGRSVQLGKTEIQIKFSNPSFLRAGMELSVVFSCSEEDKK